MKAVRVEPDSELADLAGGGFGWGHAARVPVAVSADAVAWARATFEGAPMPMRIFLVLGWRALLLEGRPRIDSGYVLGWRIEQAGPRTAVLRRRSRLGIRATLVFVVGPDTVTFFSAMVYTSRFGRIVWAVIAPIHRASVRLTLSHAPAVIARSA